MPRLVATILALLSVTAHAGTWNQENWDEMYWDGGEVSRPITAPQTSVSVDGTDFFVQILNYTEGSGEDGWSAILGYQLRCKSSNGYNYYEDFTSSTFTIGDLGEETEYTCIVRAFNSEGASDNTKFVATTEFTTGGLPIWLLYEASK